MHLNVKSLTLFNSHTLWNTEVDQLHMYKAIEVLFSKTQKVNDPYGQHIYIQERCTTFDIDKIKITCTKVYQGMKNKCFKEYKPWAN